MLAFTDANTEWKPDALRKLVRNLADDEVGYVCGQLRLESPDGANLEGVYWRYEVWVREQESTASSITAGNGAIYAVRREAYVEDDPKFGHDFGFPYLMEQNGLRAVYDREGGRRGEARERAGGRVRAQGADDRARVGAHRHGSRAAADAAALPLRADLAPRAALLERAPARRTAALERRARRTRAGSIGSRSCSSSRGSRWRRPAARGSRSPAHGLAYYYFVVTKATVAGLVRYLRSGTPQMWDKAKGTR